MSQKEDPLTRFCDELRAPLAEMRSLLHLAARAGLYGDDSQPFGRMAGKNPWGDPREGGGRRCWLAAPQDTILDEERPGTQARKGRVL